MNSKWWNTEVGAEHLTIIVLGGIAVLSILAMGTKSVPILGPLIGGLVGYLAKSAVDKIKGN